MKNKKKKIGFTLIELLAVIIVLAIIVLIATPIIFNVIENAKIKSLENSCYGVIDAVRTKYAEGLLNSEDGTVKLSGDVKDITVSGEQPIEGTWEIDNSSDSNNRGIKIKDVKFASMKDYTCTNVNSDGTINNKVTCTKGNDVSSESILKEKVLGTDDSNVVTSGDGLYSETTSNGTTYYFKGKVENNYVKFADTTWRIVRINEDGTIRLITQDNVISEQIFNSVPVQYDKMYYTNSEIKTVVDNWYKTNITDKGLDGKVASGNYFCEQAKVVWDDPDNTAGNATVNMRDNYTPSFNCATDGNGKGVVSGNVGLITIDEVLYAGGELGGNSDFYLKNDSSYWTMSLAGYFSSHANVWFIYNVGTAIYGNVDLTILSVRPVLNLSADTLASGSGTSSDPYVVK